MPTNRTTDMLRERGDLAPETAAPAPPRRPALSWAIKIKKRLKPVTPFLGKFRPVVGQCCHQCTPKSLGWKLLKASPSLGFQNLLAVNETHTRYRGWLVRRVCCVLFVGGCRVHPSPASDRAGRVCASRRVQNALTLSDGVSEQNGPQRLRLTTRGRAAHILPMVDTCISPLLLRVTSWLLLKLLSSVFCSVQVNLSQLTALHKASEMEAPLVFVSVPQCGLDYALVPLALLCHNLRVPYTVCPLWMGNTWLRSVLRRLGVIGLPVPSAAEQDAEKDSLYGPVVTSLVCGEPFWHKMAAMHHPGGWYKLVMFEESFPLIIAKRFECGRVLTFGVRRGRPAAAERSELSALPETESQLVGELLRDGQGVSVTLSPGSGRGGQWLARVWEAVRDGAVRDVSLVPVSVAYDLPPDPAAPGQGGVLSLLRYMVSMLRGGQRGSIRIHFAQAFSLKEMFETGRCRVDGGRPLQELLLPAIFKNRSAAVFGQKSVSWVLPPSCCPDLPLAERQFCIALIEHLLHSAASCTAVMSTGLVSGLLLHKHRRGVRLSQLCRDASWLLEEVLFRNRDVGFGGSLWAVVCHALSLLRPSLAMARLPPGGDPVLAPRLSPAAVLRLARHCDVLTHVFILEAVGACAVSAMLSEVARCGGGGGGGAGAGAGGGGGGGGGGEMEFDVALGQEELTEKALQLCYLLPLGHRAPCQSPLSFALDAVDSLVRCGILVMEELPRDRPVCDFLRKQGTLSWSTMDDQDHSDSDCEDQETRCYKLSQPSQCPDLLFFLCSLLSVQLRALSWAIDALPSIHTPLPEPECVAELHARLCDRARQDGRRFESSSAAVAREAVRTLTDLGALEEVVEIDGVYLGISPLFQQAGNREKLHKFICQFLCT